MDLGNNYTQFVDDIESGEFDNFLSKKHRVKLKQNRSYIKSLVKRGYSLKDAIKKVQEKELRPKPIGRQQNKRSSKTCQELAMSRRFGSKLAREKFVQNCLGTQPSSVQEAREQSEDLLTKAPNFKKLFKIGDMKKRIAKMQEKKRRGQSLKKQPLDNGIDEPIVNDIDKNIKDSIMAQSPIMEEAVIIEEAPKKSFIDKYKTLLIIGGGLAVAFLVFRK